VKIADLSLRSHHLGSTAIPAAGRLLSARDRIFRLAPDDCRRLARERQVPLQEVYRAAVAAARQTSNEGGR
jgi:hypothetical protein